MELQKREHQTRDLQLSRTSNEGFIAAVNSTKIKDCTETQLRQAIRYAMLKVGLRGENFPKGMEKSILIDHFYSNYQNLGVEEICTAFDWAITDRLPLEKNEINHYENFSCRYVSVILDAYIKLRDRAAVLKPQTEIKYLPDVRAEVSEDFFNGEFFKHLQKAIPGLTKENYCNYGKD